MDQKKNTEGNVGLKNMTALQLVRIATINIMAAYYNYGYVSICP